MRKKWEKIKTKLRKNWEKIGKKLRKKIEKKLRNKIAKKYWEKNCENLFCSGQMHVFGGFDDNYQISVVDGCKLRRLETDLPVAMQDPLCTTYADGTAVMFCVTMSLEPVDCFTFDGTNFAPVENPNFEHDQGQSSKDYFDAVFTQTSVKEIFFTPILLNINCGIFYTGICLFFVHQFRLQQNFFGFFYNKFFTTHFCNTFLIFYTKFLLFLHQFLLQQIF